MSVFLMAAVPPSAATNHTDKLTLNKAGERACQIPPPEDRHLNGSYWVPHSVIHNLTGLPNRAHSCSYFDKRSHLTSRRCRQLVALYCQDEKADVGPVARVRHTAATGEVMPQLTHIHTWQLRLLEIHISDSWRHVKHINVTHCAHPTMELRDMKK